ncbi:hypothetical protein D9M71_491020 [compost metagenome]
MLNIGHMTRPLYQAFVHPSFYIPVGNSHRTLIDTSDNNKACQLVPSPDNSGSLDKVVDPLLLEQARHDNESYWRQHCRAGSKVVEVNTNSRQHENFSRACQLRSNKQLVVILVQQEDSL